MLARAIKDARQGYRYSIRELARRAEVSPAQLALAEGQQRASDLEFKAWAETQTAAESDQVNQ
jgi:transcriptional regulator with XRE-family HTH domain